MIQSMPKRLSALDFERPTIDLPEIDLSKVDLPKVDLPKVDLPKAAMTVATAVGLSRPARPRWQFALGAAVLLAASAVIAMNRQSLMIRLDAARSAVERQVALIRRGGASNEPVAFTAAPTAPIQPSESTGETGADYPDGLGNGSGRAFQDAQELDGREAEVVGV